jgi:hypothetical protein
MDIQQAVNLAMVRGFARENIRFAHPLRVVRLASDTEPQRERKEAAHSRLGDARDGASP